MAALGLLALLATLLTVRSDEETRARARLSAAVLLLLIASFDVYTAWSDRRMVASAANQLRDAYSVAANPALATSPPASLPLQAAPRRVATEAETVVLVLDVVRKGAAEWASYSATYDGRMQAFRFENALKPSTFADPEVLQSYRDKVIEIRQMILERNTRYDGYIAQFKARIAALDIPDYQKRNALAGAEVNTDRTRRMYLSLGNAQISTVNAVDEILKFVASLAGDFVVEDGKILFHRQEHLDRYTALYATAIERAREEEVAMAEAAKLRAEYAQSTEKFMKELPR